MNLIASYTPLKQMFLILCLRERKFNNQFLANFNSSVEITLSVSSLQFYQPTDTCGVT